MNGCTFGAGSQGPGSAGAVLICHLNSAEAGASTGASQEFAFRQQAKVQRAVFVGKVKEMRSGPGQIMEPATYMAGAADPSAKATTFGFHADGGAWTFKSLAYRQVGRTHYHDGLKDTVAV